MNVAIGHSVEISKRKGLKGNSDRSKVMVLGGKEGSVC